MTNRFGEISAVCVTRCAEFLEPRESKVCERLRGGFNYSPQLRPSFKAKVPQLEATLLDSMAGASMLVARVLRSVTKTQIWLGDKMQPEHFRLNLSAIHVTAICCWKDNRKT